MASYIRKKSALDVLKCLRFAIGFIQL